MKTKLHRAVDATLEKYDGYLERALRGVLHFDDIDERTNNCEFCEEYMTRSLFFGTCELCPIAKAEGQVEDLSECGCHKVFVGGGVIFANIGAVPAILAAMCYLWAFVEEPDEDTVWCDSLQETA